MSNLNQNIKVFFIDLDGTSLDENGWMSKENIEQIKKTRKIGKEVVISTGRLGKKVMDLMQVTGIKYAVLGNGSKIINYKGEILRETKLSTKQVQQILNFAKLNNLVLKVDSIPLAFGAFTWIQKKVSKLLKFIPQSNWNFVQHEEYYKFVLWGKISRKKISKLVNDINQSVPNISAVTATGGWTIEITNAFATKGLGNSYIANEIFGIKNKAEIAHIGDTMNDSTTKEFGRLIAVKNARKSLKKITNFEGPHYKKAGLAKILRGEYTKK